MGTFIWGSDFCWGGGFAFAGGGGNFAGGGGIVVGGENSRAPSLCMKPSISYE